MHTAMTINFHLLIHLSLYSSPIVNQPGSSLHQHATSACKVNKQSLLCSFFFLSKLFNRKAHHLVSHFQISQSKNCLIFTLDCLDKYRCCSKICIDSDQSNARHSCCVWRLDMMVALKRQTESI